MSCKISYIALADHPRPEKMNLIREDEVSVEEKRMINLQDVRERGRDREEEGILILKDCIFEGREN